MRSHRAYIPLDPQQSVRLQRSEWGALATLLPYLWEFKWRVALALAFMAAAKLANVGVPLVMKEIIDALSVERPDQFFGDECLHHAPPSSST